MLKIYRIVDNTNGNVYIGKTTQTLKKRLSQHKSHKNCMSREIIKNGDYKIELIEETYDTSRERYWVENTECINRMIPGRTRKESNKEYYENNKDKILEYYENNKEKIKEYQSEYRENNKEYFRKNTKIRDKWRSSMGGRPDKNNMSLLKIDPNLFS